MQVSVCLGAILIPEYLDSILAILLLGAEEQNNRNIFRNTFLFRNIPNERALRNEAFLTKRRDLRSAKVVDG